MKNKVKILAVIMSLAMIIICFTGCGDKKGNTADVKGNTAKDIKISFWNAGYGKEWIEATVKRFEKAYPEYDVKLNISASDSALVTSLGMENIDDTDLYMLSAQTSNLDILEPLNEVFEMTAKGDSVKIGDKFGKEFKESITFPDGNFYLLPAVSAGSFEMVYNKEIFEENDIEIPRTTKELSVVCDALYSNGIAALASHKGTGYWNSAFPVWYAQYEGIDYYHNNFLACVDDKGNSPSIEVFTKKDGRYEILKAAESIFTPEYMLKGSNSQAHTIIQTAFVDGDCAMMYNGGWLENEAKSVGSMEKFGAFRLPIISTITNKLDTVKSESDLRELVSAVDSVIDGKADISEYKSGNEYDIEGVEVSEHDWNYIYSARTMAYGVSAAEGFFVPKYSTAIDGVKLFLSYMYSDENMKAIADENHYTVSGIKSGILEIDTSDWSPLAKDFYNLSTTHINFVSNKSTTTHRIFTDGGASMFAGIDFLPHFMTKNSADRWSADSAWEQIQKNVSSKYKTTWLANIS